MKKHGHGHHDHHHPHNPIAHALGHALTGTTHHGHHHHNNHHNHVVVVPVPVQVPTYNNNNNYNHAHHPHMTQAESFVRQNNVGGLRALFNANHVPTTFTDSLWHAALHTGQNPNHEIISLMALYGVPFGSHENAVLNAFKPGYFGANPKEALIRMCGDARTDATVHAQVNMGLMEGSVLSKVLRFENGMMTVNNTWEQQARACLNPVQQQQYVPMPSGRYN